MELLAERALNTHGLCGERARLMRRARIALGAEADTDSVSRHFHRDARRFPTLRKSPPPPSLEVNEGKSSADKEA